MGKATLAAKGSGTKHKHLQIALHNSFIVFIPKEKSNS